MDRSGPDAQALEQRAQASEREQSHVAAIALLVGGKSALAFDAALAHMARWPTDALLASTLLTKQHDFLDLPAGAVVAVVCCWLAGRWTQMRSSEASDALLLRAQLLEAQAQPVEAEATYARLAVGYGDDDDAGRAPEAGLAGRP